MQGLKLGLSELQGTSARHAMTTQSIDPAGVTALACRKPVVLAPRNCGTAVLFSNKALRECRKIFVQCKIVVQKWNLDLIYLN